MKTGIFLSYKGIGANLLHLSYCHQIAKKFGPITIITYVQKVQSHRNFRKDTKYIDEIIIFR